MLKKVIFDGFKSFADRVEVDFSDGITSIIGPNGCGKSNVFDGIRWVLGETSAKALRGGKMQDVIFAGCDTRKPRQDAEVTLVLENKNNLFKNMTSEDVVVTRKTYKSGKSEYLINGAPALLRDIQNLFLDTGIGANSYSMIGQEQTRKILSTKLEDRRAIFEEAAGIVKMRQQKEQTEKNLEEVDSNLTRIDDIVSEIEKQLKPLKKQAEKASSFNELKEKLKIIEVQYLLSEYDRLRLAVNETDIESSRHESDLKEAIEQIKSLEDNIKNSKEAFKNNNDLLLNSQEMMSNARESVEKLKGSISLNLERIDNSKNKINELGNSLKEIDETHSLSTGDLNTRKKKLEILKIEINEIKESYKTLMSNISALESERVYLKTEIDHLREKSIETSNNITQLNYESQQLENREIDLINKTSDLDDKYEILSKEKYSIEFKLAEEKEQIQKYRLEHDKLMSVINNLKSDINDNKTIISEKTDTLNNARAELIKKKSRLESIENFIENNEAYFAGVKTILKQNKEGKIEGVIGPIGELITVKDNYEKSIEVLLQSALQFIVVEDDLVAKKCIEFLKSSNLGRATFLPLNLADRKNRDKQAPSPSITSKGVVRAMDIINYDSKIEPILNNLLGRALIANNMDIAVDLVKSSNYSSKIATLDGEIIQNSSMTGGSNGKTNKNLFSVKKEISQLKKECISLNENVEHYINEIEALNKKVSNNNDELRKIAPTEEKLSATINSTSRNINDLEQKLDYTNERVDQLESERTESKESLTNIKNNLHKNVKLIKENREKSESYLKALELNNTKNEENDQNLNQHLNKKTEMLMNLTSLEEESKQIEIYIDSFNESNDGLEAKVTKIIELKEYEEKRVIQMTQENKEYEKILETDTLALQKLENEITTLKRNNDTLTSQIDTEETSLGQIRQTKEDLERKLNKLNVSYSKGESDLNNIKNRMEEFYKITESGFDTIDRLNIDINTSKKEIDSIKKQISDLGNINHEAINDYEVLEERYKTENEQLEDIKSAKSDLLLLIKNVEEEMSTRFVSTFEKVAVAFETTFIDLFGGGRAKLSLEEPKKPLTTAINIVAQPPGKKPVSIDVLSGGEKSLTAVALIFAIISAKPSPFIYLDEVDAPLDEANVSRFAYYLKQFSKDSQFIVVSHRKGTWLVSDSIYGLTQEERGVTIVFPYALDQLNEKMSG